MDRQERIQLKDSRMGSAFFSLYFFALIASALPDWSWAYGIVNLSLATVSTLLIIRSWMKRDHSKRYFSIMSYWFLLTMAFCSAQPIIRLMIIAESKIWILLIILWASVLLISTLMKEKVFHSFSEPNKSKASIALHLFLLFIVLATPFLIIIGSPVLQHFFRINTTFLICGFLLYIISLIVLVILPGFLKKPEEVIAQK
ncbi:hypothetical protein MGA3_16843 [Bacillus methanolicus MGA3]|uniref:Uncharacterized protein n=1 Tax=Bacillus methanolicus (strain MGA3 / ATCC 53907) TaxID=796606 RepID=I3DTZ3_BACMM|nr:hypothetical protein BMMGA3_01530 [Bacillus methanolicus MGA3]EIJ77714.1 hypothetical protein MGA3_16843 [Bacillus methanolicus MGA3]